MYKACSVRILICRRLNWVLGGIPCRQLQSRKEASTLTHRRWLCRSQRSPKKSNLPSLGFRMERELFHLWNVNSLVCFLEGERIVLPLCQSGTTWTQHTCLVEVQVDLCWSDLLSEGGASHSPSWKRLPGEADVNKGVFAICFCGHGEFWKWSLGIFMKFLFLYFYLLRVFFSGSYLTYCFSL